jgi:hypothetical protein
MNADYEDQIEENGSGLLKKIIIWSIVIFVTFMLLLTIIFQPRFFTFVT